MIMSKSGTKQATFDCDMVINISNCSLIKLMEFSNTKEDFVQNLSKSFNYFPKCGIENLIKKNLKYCDIYKQKDFVNLFKLKLPTDFSKVDSQLLSLLFSFAKKCYSELRSASTPNNNYHRCGYGENFLNLRYSISECLHYLKRFLFEIYLNNDKNDNNINDYMLCSFIINEMKNFILFIGRISQFEGHFVRSSLFYDQKEYCTSLYNHFHASLEIWWSFIEIAYIIKLEKRFNFSEIYLLKEENYVDLFTQTLRLFLYDLLFLNLFSFNKSTVKDSLYISPFTCSCMIEIIIMIKILLCNEANDSVEDVNIDRFNEFLFDTIIYFDTEHCNGNLCLMEKNLFCFNNFKTIAYKNYAAKNHKQFLLWIFANFVPLLGIDCVEEKIYFSNRIKVKIPSTVNKMYRLILKDVESVSNLKISSSEQIVSTLLILTLKYSQFLSSTSFDLLIHFVDYFLRRLNVNYNVHTISSYTIDDYQFVPKTSEKWRLLILDISNTRLNLFQYENCFKLFLLFMSSQHRTLFKQDSGSNRFQNEKFITLNFQKFISKVVVSLQPRILKSLDIVGIFNLCSFYLILINSIPDNKWMDVIDKIFNVFKEILKEKKYQILEIWIKFQYSVLHLIMENIDASRKVAQQLSKQFDQYTQEMLNTLTTKQFVGLILLYFREMHSLLELNNIRTDKNVPLTSLFTVIDYLMDNVNLVKLFTNIHSLGIHQSEICSVLEFLNELCHTTTRLLHRNEASKPSNQIEGQSSIGFNDDDLSIFNCTTNIEQSLGTSVDIDQLFNFSIKLIENLKDFVKTELVYNDEDYLPNIAFNLTLLSVELSHRQTVCSGKLNYQNMIHFFLTFSERNPQFQLHFCYLLFEDYQIISQLKQEPNADLKTLLITTWCRLLVVVDNKYQSKLNLFSKNLFRMYMDQQNPNDNFSNKDDDDNSMFYFKAFLHQLNAQYNSMNDFRDRSAHISKVDTYFQPMMRECSSIILKQKSTQMADFTFTAKIFWFTSHLIHNCSKQLYIVGKSDCILAFSIENILIPSNNCLFLKNEQCSILFNKCFPLIFEGLCKFNSDGDSYIERKLKQLIVFYLPYLVKHSSYQQIKTMFVSRDIYKFWKIHLLPVIEKIYLPTKDYVITKQLFDYLHQYCSNDISDENLRKLSFVILRTSLSDFTLKDFRSLLMQTIISRSVNLFTKQHKESKSFVDNHLCHFIKANIQNRPAKLFEVLKFLLPSNVHQRCSTIFHELCSEITQQLDDIERRSLSGNHMVLRKLFKDFITCYERNS